jgi:hypothetical protein
MAPLVAPTAFRADGRIGDYAVERQAQLLD